MADKGPDLWIFHYLGDTIIPIDTSSSGKNCLSWVRTVYQKPGLDFSLSHEAEVCFCLYTSSGQKVYEKQLGKLKPGVHTIDISGPGPGLYFLSLRTEQEIYYKKIIFTSERR